MDTERMREKKGWLKRNNPDWIAHVTNFGKNGIITTHFDSERHELENILHLIELDLITNLEFALKSPIKVVIEKR